jgi:hypothetical protein
VNGTIGEMKATLEMISAVRLAVNERK